MSDRPPAAGVDDAPPEESGPVAADGASPADDDADASPPAPAPAPGEPGAAAGPAAAGDEAAVGPADGPGETEAEDERPLAEPGGAPPPVIELEDLRVEVPGRVLLEGASLTVRRGERVLLVGPSGAGKSVLLRLLTGLLEPEGGARVRGRIRVAGASPLAPGEARRVHDAVGIVFQDHALLDELTARDNLLFARDHAASPNAQAATERALRFLEEHGIDPRARVRHLSGGQKQRVAVARALARSPSAIFYDEPTSALDPRSARAVAELIREASQDATSVVVTHDYAPFREVATRVVLLDPERRTLREIDWEELERTMSAPLAPAAPALEAGPPPGLLRGVVGRAAGAVLDVVEGTPGALVAGLRAAPLALLPVGARARWFSRWLLHYSRIVFAGSALPYNVIAGVIAGFVATYYTYKFLPRPELTEPLVLDDILPSLGFALYRIVVPVLVTILVAGRTGAALASDFGNRVYHHQTAAMRSLGARPEVYLGTAAMWASLLGILVVAAVGFWSACITSLAVFTVIQDDLTPFYWSGQFWRRLEPFRFYLVGDGWRWVLTKLLVSAFGVTAIAYGIGTRPKRSTAEVSRGITLSVYWGTVFVLLVHFVCAFFEFERKTRPLFGQ